MAEICSLLIASTAHITSHEAQFLTDEGYTRNEYGWFFYVGARGDPIPFEIEPLSEGLAGVIRQAREWGCLYVLLDRDAQTLTDTPTYNW